MSKEKGSLSIHSENIFPIIKNGFIQTMIFLLENWYQTHVTQLLKSKD